MGGLPDGASSGDRAWRLVSKPRHVLTQPHHLAARFFGSLSKRPPDPDAEAWAAGQLLAGEVALWQQMSNQDRRHSIKVARRFIEARPAATRPEVAGALLHDVGKIECGLGTWGRVVASVVGGRTERFRSYHDHEAIGARLAQRAGSDPATVELIDERGPAYEVLKACDRA